MNELWTTGCGGVGRVEEEPVWLRLQSAREEGSDSAGEHEFKLELMPFNTWQVVKIQMKKYWPGLKAIPERNIRLLYKGIEMKNKDQIAAYNLEGGSHEQPIELHYLVIDKGGNSKGDIGLYIDAQVTCVCPNALKECVSEVLAAFAAGIVPRLSDDGTGATYMLRDSANRHILAVFKPKDEEAFAPNNPRGFYCAQEDSEGLRKGVFSTQQAAREVAAYLLDHGVEETDTRSKSGKTKGFAGVPETTLVHGKHPKFVQVGGKTVWKVGAFQKFVETKDAAGNFAAQVFSVADVHRIGILDIRIVNLDRNDGNLLVRHRSQAVNKYELVPIDHGLSLPDRLEVYTDDIAWMSWPQAHKPFGEKELKYIKSRLSGSLDAKLLKTRLGIRRDCLRLMEVTTKMLQVGAQHGLTLYEIGTIIYRDGTDGREAPSPLEKIIEKAVDTAWAIAGENPDGGSATLAGLDLQTSRKNRLRNSVDDEIAGMGTLRLSASPFQSPVITAQSSGPQGFPPPLSLGCPSSPEGSPEGVPFTTVIGLSLDDDPKAVAEMLAEKQTTSRYKSGSAARPSNRTSSNRLKREGTRPRTSTTRTSNRSTGPDEIEQGAIFYRRGLKASDWSQELETIFKRQVTEDLLEYITKTFPRRTTENAADADGTSQSETPAQVEEAPATEVDKEEDAFSKSLASAFPAVMPSDLGPPRARYVPPHLRNQLRDDAGDAAYSESCTCTSSSEPTPMEAASDVLPTIREDSEAPLRPRYVPPQRRALDAAEAAEQPITEETSERRLMEADITAAEAACEADAIATLKPLKPRYVPPQLRALAAAGGGGGGGGCGGGGGGEGGASSEEPEKPQEPEREAEKPKRMYVNPFQRKKAEAEAAEAAAAAAAAAAVSGADDAAAAAASGSQSTSSTAPAPTSTPVPLPTDESGGTSRCGFCVNQGPRPGMEDAIDAQQRLPGEIHTEFYAAYDGHSGVVAVDFVKRRLPGAISAHDGFNDPSRIETVLSDAFTLTDNELLSYFRQQPKPATGKAAETEADAGGAEEHRELQSADMTLSSGCVACVALIRGTTIYIVNLGDCRAVLCRAGDMVPLTKDHSPLENEDERRRLEDEGVDVSCDGYLHGRIGVSRAFGDWAWNAEKKCPGVICNPEVSQAEVTEDAEFLLLACDGIFEKMGTKEAGQIVRRRLRATRDPKAAAEALVKNALKRNGTDNLSAVIVVFNMPASNDGGRVAPRLFTGGSALAAGGSTALHDAAAGALPDAAGGSTALHGSAAGASPGAPSTEAPSEVPKAAG